jgi:hypothetical protein
MPLHTSVKSWSQLNKRELQDLAEVVGLNRPANALTIRDIRSIVLPAVNDRRNEGFTHPRFARIFPAQAEEGENGVNSGNRGNEDSSEDDDEDDDDENGDGRRGASSDNGYDDDDEWLGVQPEEGMDHQPMSEEDDRPSTRDRHRSDESASNVRRRRSRSTRGRRIERSDPAASGSRHTRRRAAHRRQGPSPRRRPLTDSANAGRASTHHSERDQGE